jgi:ParB-like chromosome segregation protein Spo0J
VVDIIIKPEYERLVPEISDIEYKALKESIKEKGLFFPIIINQKGEILDGHHRYRVCKELGLLQTINPQELWKVQPFYDDLLEKEFVI